MLCLLARHVYHIIRAWLSAATAVLTTVGDNILLFIIFDYVYQ